MVAPSRFKIFTSLILTVVLAVGIGLWLANRIESNHHHVSDQMKATFPKTPSRVQATKAPLLNGNLHIASAPIETAMNEAKWPSSSKAQNSTPAATFVTSMSALARGDLRTFALAMSKPAQSAFLEGRSIDDPYFQTLPQKMAEAGFQTLTVESFKAERKAGSCKLIATLSSIRGKQKIVEEITMELTDSSSGWLIEKYESRTAKREAIIQNK